MRPLGAVIGEADGSEQLVGVRTAELHAANTRLTDQVAETREKAAEASSKAE